MALTSMLLTWTQYYEKAVVEPLNKLKDLKTNAVQANAELLEKAKIETNIVGKSCKESHQQLQNISEKIGVLGLESICDQQLMDSVSLTADLEKHVAGSMETVDNNIDMIKEKFNLPENGEFEWEGQKGRNGQWLEAPNAWPDWEKESHSLWKKSSRYFGETTVYKKYLRGWKAFNISYTGKGKEIEGKYTKMFDNMRALLSQTEDQEKEASKIVDELNRKSKQNADDHKQAASELESWQAKHKNEKDILRSAVSELDAATTNEGQAADLLKQMEDALAAAKRALKGAHEVFDTTHAEISSHYKE
jgi:multidrug efflux pump subunit AcrB